MAPGHHIPYSSFLLTKAALMSGTYTEAGPHLRVTGNGRPVPCDSRFRWPVIRDPAVIREDFLINSRLEVAQPQWAAHLDFFIIHSDLPYKIINPATPRVQFL
jgi:hypothetical protein